MKYLTYPKTIARELIKDAEAVCFHKWLDELNCSESIARRKTDKTLDEIISLCETTPSHFTIIERADSIGRFHDHERYYEIGASTLSTEISYFIWILVSVEEGERLIKKYNLSMTATPKG